MFESRESFVNFEHLVDFGVGITAHFIDNREGSAKD